jgi:vitamin B12 transporter
MSHAAGAILRRVPWRHYGRPGVQMFTLVNLAAAVSAATPLPPEILVTASLSPAPAAIAPASVSVVGSEQIMATALPLVADYLRLVPGVSVASSGGPGAQAQVRIRGGEANHTLVFIDGIAFDDVAADDQARFESLPASGLSRIEIVRGPQSALWGSEALGGVVALQTPDPLKSASAVLGGEYGARGGARADASIVTGGSIAGVSATAAYARSDGIDILGHGSGDRDGFENLSGSLKAVARPGGVGEIGIVGRYIRHDNSYDGTDAQLQRADTDDSSRAETWGVRAWATPGSDPGDRWSLTVDGQHLRSANRNRRARQSVNDSFGRRSRFGGTATYRGNIGMTSHAVNARIEREEERFVTRDRKFGGGDRRLRRARTAYVAEWHAGWAGRAETDLAIRRDDFDAFRDATTLRAHIVLPLVAGLTAVGGYGEGIAQPGFAELFGFAANTGFVGNARLTPEHSRGIEVGLRYGSATVSAEIVGFSNRLRDEIVYAALPPDRYTYVNGAGTSRRRGVEASLQFRPTTAFTIRGAYTFLDAREPRLHSAPPTPQEVRRPRRTGSLSAEWQTGQLTAGGSLAWVGARRDIDFDSFAPTRLAGYLLADGRVALALTPSLEIFGRIANAFDTTYQDVVGYATAGRTMHAGLRYRFDR